MAQAMGDAELERRLAEASRSIQKFVVEDDAESDGHPMADEPMGGGDEERSLATKLQRVLSNDQILTTLDLTRCNDVNAGQPRVVVCVCNFGSRRRCLYEEQEY